MLDMGFEEDMETILSQAPAERQVRTGGERGADGGERGA